jgi:hypothetical protein
MRLTDTLILPSGAQGAPWRSHSRSLRVAAEVDRAVHHCKISSIRKQKSRFKKQDFKEYFFPRFKPVDEI